MATLAWRHPRTGIWRFSGRDALLVVLAAGHAVVLAAFPLAPIMAVGLWWNSNTIAHNFIHRPFFRSAPTNRAFSAALSVLLGIPQTLWRERHLAHHAGIAWRFRASTQLAAETALVLALWAALVIRQPRFFLLAYLPGYLAGLALCAMQGYWEHAAGRPTSHYGRVYNFLCFNDGYHLEHHADPSVHWAALPRRIEDCAPSSWPPLLRWLERPPLVALECLVLRSTRLRAFVLRRHRAAFQAFLPQLTGVRRVVIVGGGLFPRTALLLRDLLPAARLIIIDSDRRHLEIARMCLDAANRGAAIEFRHERYIPGCSYPSDLTVFPLCFEGDRAAVYRRPPAPAVLLHDWIWRRWGHGVVVSVLLLKRLNLVRP